MRVERSHGGRPPEGLVDVSAPANPLGPPGWALEAAGRGLERLGSYPDPEYSGLRRALSRITGARLDWIVPLNGSAEAPLLLAAALRPRSIVSVEPTFGDHRLLAWAAGMAWEPYLAYRGRSYIVDPGEYCRLVARVPGPVLGLVSNPNNPTGSLLDPSIIREMAHCTPGVLLVDEAFIRLSDRPWWSLQQSPPDGAVVSGSLTKDLALPGVRLGYLVARDPLVWERLEAARQPWNVNPVAEEVALEASRDPGRLGGLLGEARRYTAMARRLMEEAAGELVASESHAPYLLLEGEGLHDCLAGRGYYARPASSFHGLGPRHVRVSIPPPRVLEGLAAALEVCSRGV